MHRECSIVVWTACRRTLRLSARNIIACQLGAQLPTQGLLMPSHSGRIRLHAVPMRLCVGPASRFPGAPTRRCRVRLQRPYSTNKRPKVNITFFIFNILGVVLKNTLGCIFVNDNLSKFWPSVLRLVGFLLFSQPPSQQLV